MERKLRGREFKLEAVKLVRKRPYGNKDVAMELGARYGSAGWYAPPGVDLAAFGEWGWL